MGLPLAAPELRIESTFTAGLRSFPSAWRDSTDDAQPRFVRVVV